MEDTNALIKNIGIDIIATTGINLYLIRKYN